MRSDGGLRRDEIGAGSHVCNRTGGRRTIGGQRRERPCGDFVAPAQRLGPHFPVFYTGKNGRVAHECILDMRHLKKLAGVDVEDVAKRLMDYGYHAPTMSFPIASTMMVEPTES